MLKRTPLSVLFNVACCFSLIVLGAVIWHCIVDPPPPPPPPIPTVVEILQKLVPDLELSNQQWQQLADEHGSTAVNVAKSYGKDGLLALLKLGTQAVSVMREQPEVFREIAKRLEGPTAAAFLISFADHLETLAKHEMLTDFLDRLESLPDKAKVLSQKYPQMSLYVVLAPEVVLPALEDHPDLCLMCFAPIDLRSGPAGLIKVAKAIQLQGANAKSWVEVRGLDGILLADVFPEFVGHEPHQLTLPTFLQILSRNQDDIASLIKGGQIGRVYEALELIATESGRWPEYREGREPPFEGEWLELACSDARTVRFVIDTGRESFRVLEGLAGEMADSEVTLPTVLYDGYKQDSDRPDLWQHAWDSLRLTDGDIRRLNFQMLSTMAWRTDELQQSVHPRVNRFRTLLQRLDHRATFYLSMAECDSSTVEGKYRKLEHRGTDELDAMQNPESLLAAAIPGYDATKLAFVLYNGYRPTFGEVGWATLDAAFITIDLITIWKGPPVSGVAKSGFKAALIGSSKTLARQTVNVSGDVAGRVFSTRVMRMICSPAAVAKIAEKKLGRVLATGALLAEKTAAARQIHLRLTKYTVREWTINVVVGKGVEQGVQRIPTDTYWGETAMETLESLKFLDQPIQ